MVFQGHEPSSLLALLIMAFNWSSQLKSLIWSLIDASVLELDNAYFIWVLPLAISSMPSPGFEPALRSVGDQRSAIAAILDGQQKMVIYGYLNRWACQREWTAGVAGGPAPSIRACRLICLRACQLTQAERAFKLKLSQWGLQRKKTENCWMFGQAQCL